MESNTQAGMSNLQITFRDNLSQPDREAAQRSVIALVTHTAEEAAKVRTAAAEQAKLVAALNAPFKKLIEEDPTAVEALDALRTRKQSMYMRLANELRQESPLTERTNLFIPHTLNSIAIVQPLDFGAPQPEGARAIEVRVPPHYDFFWSWHDPAGGPPFGQVIGGIESVTGFIGLEARSGDIEGGADGWVFATAGYGLNLTTDRPVTVVGRSFKRMEFEYSAKAVGISNATCEGGMEFGARDEDGSFLNFNRQTEFHKRVSGSFPEFSEEAFDHQGPYAVSEPSELAFTMQPGRRCTFLVGVWVSTDRGGAGWRAARSLIKADVLAITIQR